MKQKTLTQLKKLLDKRFSEWIRQRDKGKCFTCSTQKNWKYMQAGHWVSRRHFSLRWDERNVNTQCPACNLFKHGAMDVYAIRMQEKYGPEILKELNKQKNTIKKWTRGELENLIERYS